MKTSIIPKFGLAACALTLAATTALAELPDKFVRYVESTGSQWVDTGIVGRYGTKAECKVAWLELGDKAFLDCGDWSNNTRFFMCHCSTTSGQMFLGYRTGTKVHKTYDLLFETKRIYTYTTDVSAPDGDDNTTVSVTIDGTTADTVVEKSLNTAQNLYVFAMNHNGSAYGHSKTRCYGLKIWQIPDGGSTLALVRDFKPCVKGNRAGLYDTVSETIFYSGSGTDLTYDENCDVPDAFIDYVESFGNSYIDTGITGRTGTGAKMEIAVTYDYDNAILASRNVNDRFYLIHNNGSSKWGYGYGAYSNFGTRALNKRYYIDSSFIAGSQVIKIGENGPDGATTTYVNATSGTPIDTGRSMYLFCCNQSGSALAKQYWGKARVYWLQIFQDGDMVRDFRPCLKYGEAALYDDISKTIFYPEGDPLGYDNSVAAEPDEVIYVDYIESDGYTHYLDTGVSAESPTRAEGTFSWTRMRTKVEEEQRLAETYRSYLACGCYNSSSDANRFYMITETAQKPWIGYGNNSQSFGSAFVAGTKYDFDVSFAAGEQTVSLTPEGGSTTTTSSTWSGDASGQGNLYLFACNDAKNKKPIYRSATKCYGLTIWQGETKVREFKPCVKDGQAALYDTVSNRIFYPTPAIPAAEGAGPILSESVQSPVDAYLEYVETDGTQYIDTEVVGKAATTAEFIETNLRPNVGDGNGEECFLGAIGSDSNSRFYMWYHAGKDTLGFGYGNAWWRPSLSDPNTPAAQWNVGYDDVYRLEYGDTTHARVSFAEGSQTFTVINDATGAKTPFSTRTLSGNVDTGNNLYIFARNNNGTPDSFAKSRLYWLKLKQDGSLVRKFQPVRLKNSLVGLWDFVEGKAYLPKTSTGGFAQFSAIGDETDKLPEETPFTIVVR